MTDEWFGVNHPPTLKTQRAVRAGFGAMSRQRAAMRPSIGPSVPTHVRLDINACLSGYQDTEFDLVGYDLRRIWQAAKAAQKR